MAAEELADRLNSYNLLRDERRGLEASLSGDHTQRQPIERRIAAKTAKIREQTDWIGKHYVEVLEPKYRQRILGIAAAKSAVEDLRDALAKGEGELIAAERESYATFLKLRNAARAAGKPKPIRFDMPKPKSRSGQLSTWTPGLPT